MTLKEKYKDSILTIKYLSTEKSITFQSAKIIDELDTFIEIIYGIETPKESKILLNKSRIISIISK